MQRLRNQEILNEKNQMPGLQENNPTRERYRIGRVGEMPRMQEYSGSRSPESPIVGLGGRSNYLTTFPKIPNLLGVIENETT
jgi:hypothetical protein